MREIFGFDTSAIGLDKPAGYRYTSPPDSPMSEAKQLNVGLVGAGVVGGGVVKHLSRNADLIAERLGVRINLKWVCDKDESRLKSLPIPASQKTGDAQKVLQDPDIHVVVELVGGTGFAKTLILDALNRGKVVVTANKALLAHHGEEIFGAAAKNSTNIFYEASVCGGIPIIKALREGFVANRFPLIYGIVNGTCNYILTRMTAEGKDFNDVLAEAQTTGLCRGRSVARRGRRRFRPQGDNPRLAGARFLDRLRQHVCRRHPSRVAVRHPDRPRTRLHHQTVGRSSRAADNSDSAPVEVRVHPTLIPHKHVLASVNGVFNGVVVRGDVVGDTMFYGRGAGADATASAVISDLADAALNLNLAASNACRRSSRTGSTRACAPSTMSSHAIICG